MIFWWDVFKFLYVNEYCVVRRDFDYDLINHMDFKHQIFYVLLDLRLDVGICD